MTHNPLIAREKPAINQRNRTQRQLPPVSEQNDLAKGGRSMPVTGGISTDLSREQYGMPHREVMAW